LVTHRLAQNIGAVIAFNPLKWNFGRDALLDFTIAFITSWKAPAGKFIA
jgi:hypothetical protein